VGGAWEEGERAADAIAARLASGRRAGAGPAAASAVVNAPR
jgi:hypothetical protein